MSLLQGTGPEEGRLGEVVEASSSAFTVHCYQLNGAAPLGALVRSVAQEPTYGVVQNVATVPLDAGRRPVALGQEEADQEALYRSHPQLSRLFRTEFAALIVGHRAAGRLYQYLPPRPPAIHAFVETCPKDEVRAFSERLDFLPLLLSAGTSLADEVVAAFLRQAASAHEDASLFLASAGRRLATLLARDLLRLNVLLRAIQP
ncbi:MAG: hypothetical protein HY535_09190 [Chloroflexi bacterium]|nr:hypothetical protein [Chloroflexota bacterium]